MVKTSFSRPPSKPRVRNPLPLLKSHSQGQGISPPLSSYAHPPIPSIGNKASTDSPTQVEKDFLAKGGATATPPPNWGEGSQDEDYFVMIPEDTTILDQSLSTSLASICGLPGNKDGETSSDLSVSLSVWPERERWLGSCLAPADFSDL